MRINLRVYLQSSIGTVIKLVLLIILFAFFFGEESITDWKR